MAHLKLIVGLVAAACLSAPAASQAVYKDTHLGFSFKPPKEFKGIPVSPTERTTIVKYQSDQTDVGGTDGLSGFNSMFQLRYYPKGRFTLSSADTGDEDEDSEPGSDEGSDEGEVSTTPSDPLTDFATMLRDVRFSKYVCTKNKAIKVGNAPAIEMTFEKSKDTLAYYCLVLQQDDGLYEFEGTSVPQRFTKNAAEFASSAKSFKRIDRVDDHAKQAKISQMDEQDRFLQAQIDKLPPGWSYMRTKRYMFLYDADKGFVQELAERIEAMRDQYERDYVPDHPITTVSIVRVCGSRDTYLGYGGSPSSGGYWNWVARELVVFDYPPREFTLAVINHEAFHQYIFYFYGQLSPHSWYNEGTGDFYAGAKISKSNRVQGFGEAPGGIGRTADIKEGARLLSEGKKPSEGAAAPPKLLMHFHQREYYGSVGYSAGLCYAEGWSIVSFLRLGKNLDPKWQKILPDYLKALLSAREEVAKDVMEKAFAKAEKEEAGSSASLPQELKEWYDKVDEEKVQDRAFEKTFSDWTDGDWTTFQVAWLKYVEKL